MTKSISRFARNTVDLLETVRHLKSMGIEVWFEKENIHSMSSDGELMLSILASFAQEESRSISENSKWGIRKRFQSGEIGAANKHILGYQYNDSLQRYMVIPQEAKIVKRMFQLYLERVSLQGICDGLNDAGYRTINGNLFQEASLNTLLHNEIYVGDIRRQKCYVADPISKSKVKNQGDLPQYYMADCHEAIIDRETYALVEQEFKRRTSMLNPTYCFTGKIKCGICGKSYARKKGAMRDKTYVSWICRAKKEKGMTCTSVNFTEDELKRICTQVLELPSFDEEVFTNEVKSIIVLENGSLEFHFIGGRKKVWKNLNLHPARHEATITDCFQGKIRCAICGNTYHRVNGANKWVYWYCIGKKRKGITCKNTNYADFQLRRISAHMMGIEGFDEAEFEKQIQEISVLEDGSLEYRFYDGRAKRWEKV